MASLRSGLSNVTAVSSESSRSSSSKTLCKLSFGELPPDIVDSGIITKKPKGNPARDKARWYVKDNFMDPYLECVSQELFRLVLPDRQPKTRILVDKGKKFIASKEVKEMSDPSKIKKCGLGNLLVTSLWVGENDLNAYNMLVDTVGREVKIDGGQAFYKVHQKPITELTIRRLPFLDKNYKALNWLDMIKSDVDSEDSEKESKFADLAHDPDFRYEVNNGLLKIITLPDTFLKEFINEYVDDEKVKAFLHHEVIQRKLDLTRAALANDSFRAYINETCSEQDLCNRSEGDFYSYLFSLKEFKTMGKRKPFTHAHVESMKTIFTAIQKQCQLLSSHGPEETKKNMEPEASFIIARHLEEEKKEFVAAREEYRKAAAKGHSGAREKLFHDPLFHKRADREEHAAEIKRQEESRKEAAQAEISGIKMLIAEQKKRNAERKRIETLSHEPRSPVGRYPRIFERSSSSGDIHRGFSLLRDEKDRNREASPTRVRTAKGSSS